MALSSTLEAVNSTDMNPSLDTGTRPREEALPPVGVTPCPPSHLSTPSMVSYELTGSESETTDNDEGFATMRQ